jgi:hypothetical protein
MNTKALAGVGAVAAIGGLVVTLRLLAPAGVSALAIAPDAAWADWPPDASMVVGCYVGPSVFTSYCTLATSTGYVEEPATLIPLDGGAWTLGAVRSPSCWCASDAGACLLSDGGAAPGGTIDPHQWGTPTGPGCLRRPCIELSSTGAFENTGAPAGCAP